MKTNRLPWGWSEDNAKEAYTYYRSIMEEPLVFTAWLQKHIYLENILEHDAFNPEVRELSELLGV